MVMNTHPGAEGSDKLGRDCRDVLQTYFGYDDFRGVQAGAIPYVAGGGDALILMATGGGKSLCFQIPGLLRDGVCVVISPLVALMTDQVRELRERGIQAGMLTATTGREERNTILQQLHKQDHDALKFLFVAPERLNLPEFKSSLSACNVALYAIDEAHCVSSWGTDFRDDYRDIGRTLDSLPNAPRVALTATADRVTQNDIIASLGLRQPERFVSTFSRPNIAISLSLASKKSRDSLMRDVVAARSAVCGIVYCRSRKDVERVSTMLEEELQGLGLQTAVLSYHGGMAKEEREHNQTRFMTCDACVMVATIGFGMGINRKDIRYVFHNGLPDSTEAYYQEIGRAGRDGNPSEAIGVYDMSNIENMFRHLDAAHDIRAYTRFRSMLALTEGGCREVSILNSFGEEGHPPCGRCDRCRGRYETLDDEQSRSDLKLLISVIDDCTVKSGLNHYVDIINGTRTRKILERNDESSPYFGARPGMTTDYWSHLLRYSLMMGWSGYRFSQLENSAIIVGRIHLSKTGQKILHDSSLLEEVVRKVPVTKPGFALTSHRTSVNRAAGIKLSRQAPESVKATHEHLTALRDAMALKRNIAPQAIADDRALIDISASLDKSGLNIGLSGSLAQAFGDKCLPEFMAAVEKYQRENTINSTPVEAALSSFSLRGFASR